MLRRRQPDRDLVTPDGSRIAELIGRASTGDESWSIARIVMPPGGGQPPRHNRFDEVLIIVAGSCEVDLADDTLALVPDDVLELPAGTRYAERGGPDGCVAWAICRPAFHRDLVDWDVTPDES